MAKQQYKESADSRDKRILRTFNDLYARVAGGVLQPPQAVEVEQSVLGACLIDKRSVAQTIAVFGNIEWIGGSVFYREAHLKIYTAICKVSARKENVDILSVANQLKSSGDDDEVGGPQYLVELTSKVVTTANVKAHCLLIVEKYFQRQIISFCEETKLRAFGAGEDDDAFSTLIDNMQAFTQRIRGAVKDITTLGKVSKMVESLDKILFRVENNQADPFIPTSIYSYNQKYGGWYNECIVAGARPSHGKTVLGLQEAKHIAQYFVEEAKREKTTPKGVAYFSLEMPDIRLVQRMLSSESGVFLSKIRKAELSNNDKNFIYAAYNRIKDLPLYFINARGMNASQIRSEMLSMKNEFNIGFFFTDYLQLVALEKVSGNLGEDYGAVMKTLYSAQQEVGVPSMVLSQLNRDVKDRKSWRPRMTDFKNTGSIEEAADTALLLFYPGQDKSCPDFKPDEPDYYEVIQAKARDEELTTFPLKLDGARMMIRDPFDGLGKALTLEKAAAKLTLGFEGDDREEEGNDDNPF